MTNDDKALVERLRKWAKSDFGLVVMFEAADRIEAQAAEIERLRGALDMLDQQSEALGGCSDGSCVIHRPKGMHTNGGCRCWDDRDKMRRWTQYVGYFRHKARAALGETE